MPAEEVLRALRHIWISLEPLQLPRAIMGGVALSAWGHVRATQDVDVLVNLAAAEPDTLLRALEQRGFRRKREPPVLSIGPTRIMQLLYQVPGTFLDLQVDLLFADCEYQRQALDRRVPARLPGLDIEIFVLSCEDLILHKLIAGRLIDRADAVALLRANRDTLNLEYLRRWVNQLELTAEWSEIWSAEFPGDHFPCPATDDS